VELAPTVLLDLIEKKAEVIEGHDAAIAPMRAAAMDEETAATVHPVVLIRL
jgi:hypothetical protein